MRYTSRSQFETDQDCAKRVKRTERGWAGHFICAQDCRFRRNTLLEYGETRVVISTVGAMFSRFHMKGSGPEEIGYNRHYETMIFHAHKDGEYWEADVRKEWDGARAGDWQLLMTKENEDQIDNLANDMHEKNVNAIAKELKRALHEQKPV